MQLFKHINNAYSLFQITTFWFQTSFKKKNKKKPSSIIKEKKN